MSNYIEHNDKIAFHPGYYLKEIIEESSLTKEDFARKLGITPEDLKLLLNGEQSITVEMAEKLSKMLGTSANYWLNLQTTYDSFI